MIEQADRLIKLAAEMKKAQIDAMWKDVAKDVSAIRWTDRPLTDEDKEHYGSEGENK